MYALMAKCEELNRTIAPVYELKEQMYPFTNITSLRSVVSVNENDNENGRITKKKRIS